MISGMANMLRICRPIVQPKCDADHNQVSLLRTVGNVAFFLITAT